MFSAALTRPGSRTGSALGERALRDASPRSRRDRRDVAGDDETLEALRSADSAGDWVAALSHERLPFVSYPYEWTFSMLKDAALLQLRLTAAALAEDLMLKDASPYNVQWRGCRPVFIDVGSFERLRAGEPWAAYRQFCMLYLYPLLLEAYRGVPFQPWLRGASTGSRRSTSVSCSRAETSSPRDAAPRRSCTRASSGGTRRGAERARELGPPASTSASSKRTSNE